MKKVFLCFILAGLSFSLSAQTNKNDKSEAVKSIEVNSAKVKIATEEMTKRYELTPPQAKIMGEIQTRKFKNLAQVETLKGGERSAYLSKLESIRKGTNASIKRMLTPRQMLTFNEIQSDRRKKESEIIKELKAKGISRNEIYLTVIERMNGKK